MRFRSVLSTFLLLVALAPTVSRADEAFLDPLKAFPLTARVLDAERVEVRFDVAPGYYLYRDKFGAAAVPSGPALGELQIPRGKVKYDETFEKDVETLRGQVALVLPVPRADAAQRFQVRIGNQGCADKGLCYPPMERSLDVETGPSGLVSVAIAAPEAPAARAGSGGRGLLSALTSPQATAPAGTALPVAGTVAASPAPGGTDDEAFGRALQSRNLLSVAGVFLLAGLLLAFTPCVLPMVPILSSIIVGQAERPSRAKGFTLALSYSLGMAIVYTAFGIAAALLGEGLGAALQNAWVLGAFALLLSVLSLSMFGVYELQVPPGWQERFSAWSGRFKGGRHAGVFVMGGLSAVIVGPCVAAPLAGALVYIGQTRDTLLGGLALFSMAIGMSVPLLLVGLSAGTLLPRSGAWMKHVKHFFGLLLLAVALWMVSPVIPVWTVMTLAAVLLLASGVYLGAFEPLHGHGTHPGRTFAKGIGLVLSVLAALQLVGVASGGRSLLQPLQHLGSRAAESPLAFAPVRTLDQLDAAVGASAKPVFVDFYADWCVSCKEFEAFTLTDAAVRDRMAAMTLLRIDVTANNADDKALLKRHGLFGPPAMLFYAPAGAELPGSRVIGFKGARDFLAHLDRIAPLMQPVTRTP